MVVISAITTAYTSTAWPRHKFQQRYGKWEIVFLMFENKNFNYWTFERTCLFRYNIQVVGISSDQVRNKSKSENYNSTLVGCRIKDHQFKNKYEQTKINKIKFWLNKLRNLLIRGSKEFMQHCHVCLVNLTSSKEH